MITLLLCAELLLIIVWGLNNVEYTAKDLKIINLRHDLMVALNDKLPRKERQAVDDELFLLLERF